MTYATADDVTSRWVGPGAPSTAQAATFIADAETIIDADFPNIADAITDGTLTSDVVKLVVVAMVIRHFRNPAGIRSKSDDGNGTLGGTIVWAGDNPGALELTSDERARLSPGAADDQSRFGGIGVLSTTRGPIETGPIGVCYPTEETIPW